MLSGIPLHEVKHESSKDLVHTWDYLIIGDWKNTRLYYNPIAYPINANSDEKELGGFHFYGVTFNSCPANDEMWEDSTEVNTLVQGVAYWDGLRHLYVGDEGYLYYANPLLLVEIFTKLRELETLYCRENDGDKY